jgi:hypothetical protein
VINALGSSRSKAFFFACCRCKGGCKTRHSCRAHVVADQEVGVRPRPWLALWAKLAASAASLCCQDHAARAAAVFAWTCKQHGATKSQPHNHPPPGGEGPDEPVNERARAAGKFLIAAPTKMPKSGANYLSRSSPRSAFSAVAIAHSTFRLGLPTARSIWEA